MLGKSSIFCILAVAVAGLLAGCESKSVTAGVSGVVTHLNVIQEFGEEEEKMTIVQLNSEKEVILRYGDEETNRFGDSLVTKYDQLARKEGTNRFGTFLSTHAEVGENIRANLYSFGDNDFTRRYIELATLKDGKILLEVRGDKPIDLPNGEHSYVGTNILAVHGDRGGNHWGTDKANGEFRMLVDFSRSIGSIEGDTARRNAAGTDNGLDGSRIAGEFEVDIESGMFSGEDGVYVTNASSLIRFPALLYGSFHGKGAAGVTGLYVEKLGEDDTSVPKFYGAISGLLGTQATTLQEVRKFKNEYNVVRVETLDEHILRFGHNESNNPRRGIVIDDLEVSPGESNDYGQFHKGRVYIGLEGNGKLYRFVDKDVDGLYFDLIEVTLGGSGDESSSTEDPVDGGSNEDMDNEIRNVMEEDRILFEVGGGSEFTIPTGSHKYTGTNMFGVNGTRSENSWGTGNNHGTFTMDVNFDDRTAVIDANTQGRDSKGTDGGLDGMKLHGSVSLNTADGTFSGNELNVTNSKTNHEFDAVINGSFHGDGARGVTGLYVEQHDNPRFFGAVVGVRDDVRNETN